ncbi:hypothetical protein F4804DRAFT_334331 [Jackrogersella minutella]|nr:hypothetical protein F4804DRAFT_334331 [Jackrogersella minutella]
MYLMRVAVSAVFVTGLLNLAGALAIAPATGNGVQLSAPLSHPMRKTPHANIICGSTAQYIEERQNAVHRCYEPSPESDPTPSVEDCKGVITKLQAVQGDITVKLVEGCYEVWNGNCTGSVCPQRLGESTISPSLAAQYMTDSVMTECISKGLRGWYLDRDYGIGVYLS